jgi:hypothetical protein
MNTDLQGEIVNETALQDIREIVSAINGKAWKLPDAVKRDRLEHALTIRSLSIGLTDLGNILRPR